MTDWDKRWREGETPWEKGEPAPPLLELLANAEESELIRGASGFVPGCGSGHDVRALASAGARVLGLDLSPYAVEKARSHAPVNHERYAEGDLFKWSGEVYDFAWEHTCFCAIDPSCRDDYGESMGRLIRTGGVLFGVFYLNPWDPGEKAEGPPFGVTKEEIIKHLKPWFSLNWGKQPSQAYPGREGREWLASFQRL